MPRVVTLKELREIFLSACKMLSREVDLKGTTHDCFHESILEAGCEIGHELPSKECVNLAKEVSKMEDLLDC